MSITPARPTASQRLALAAKLASAILWQEHFEREGSDVCAQAELERARDLASQLLGQKRSQYVPSNAE